MRMHKTTAESVMDSASSLRVSTCLRGYIQQLKCSSCGTPRQRATSRQNDPLAS